MSPINGLPIRWLPPEFIARILSGSNRLASDLFSAITKESNMWTLGITLWEIAAFGDTPYQSLYNSQFLSNTQELTSLLSRGPGPLELSVKTRFALLTKIPYIILVGCVFCQFQPSFAHSFMPIINACLAMDPRDRPTTSIVKMHLEVMLNNAVSTENSV